MKNPLISLLYFSNSDARGGAEEHILTLLRGLDRQYFRLHLVCRPTVAEKLRSDLTADVELIPLSLYKPSQVQAAARLAKILRERRVDILHSHLFYASLFASPVGWLCRVPVIIETPHVRENWRRGWLKSKFVIDRLQGRFVTHYIAVSEANARYLKEDKRLPAQKITVIHNGSDLRRFDPSHQAPSGLKASLGFNVDDPILLLPGRLEPQKAHSVLLEAIRPIRCEFGNVRLICAGEGALRTDLEHQVLKLGLKDCVRFVGYQPNIADWFALADLTILPSFYEGLPLVAIESLAAGRPIIATAVDGTPEIVIDGKTGVTVPPGDPQSLAKAVCKLLADSKLRRELAVAGRHWVLDRFGQERQVLKTQELYFRALREHVSAREGLRTVPREVEQEQEAHGLEKVV